jgi:hypothetical protein
MARRCQRCSHTITGLCRGSTKARSPAGPVRESRDRAFPFTWAHSTRATLGSRPRDRYSDMQRLWTDDLPIAKWAIDSREPVPGPPRRVARRTSVQTLPGGGSERFSCTPLVSLHNALYRPAKHAAYCSQVIILKRPKPQTGPGTRLACRWDVPDLS